jgi:adenylate cyclase
MGDDERATVATLDDCRAVFRTHVAAQSGRVVDTAGDSVLAAFPSAIGAVRAAVAIQADLQSLNKDLAEDRRMRFRIGINLGDVLEKTDGTVYGDGVNIAARLESLAEPGGLTISGTTFDHIDGKLDVTFAYLGEKAVKNIAKPVRAYRASDRAEDTVPQPMAAGPEAERPSIAVLPFQNLSGDAEQEYFADGISEDLITELSRLRWLMVTARNSTFTYKGKVVDVKQIGAELGVRYVVEGSVRKGGNRVRISAQLIDATTGNHIWAERYDRELADLFDLQDEITETIVTAIQPELSTAERERARRKPPDSLDAWESYQRGFWHLYKFNPEDNVEARKYFEQAIELDPDASLPFAGLSFTHLLDVSLSFRDAREESLDHALRAAQMALANDEMDALAQFTIGRVRLFMGEIDTALTGLRTAVKLAPSFALAHYGLGHALYLAGQSNEAIDEFDEAIRLSPFDPYLWLFETIRASASITREDYLEAIEYALRATQRPTVGYWAYVALACALGHLDRIEEARSALANLQQMKPDFSMEYLEDYLRFANVARVDLIFDGLRKAGLTGPNDAG